MDGHSSDRLPIHTNQDEQLQSERSQVNVRNVPSGPAAFPNSTTPTNASGVPVFNRPSGHPLSVSSLDGRRQSPPGGVQSGGGGAQETRASAETGSPAVLQLVYLWNGRQAFQVWMPVSATMGGIVGGAQANLDRRYAPTGLGHGTGEITSRKRKYVSENCPEAAPGQSSGYKPGYPQSNISGCSTQTAPGQVRGKHQENVGGSSTQAASERNPRIIPRAPKIESIINKTSTQKVSTIIPRDADSRQPKNKKEGIARAAGKQAAVDGVSEPLRMASYDIGDGSTESQNWRFTRATPNPEQVADVTTTNTPFPGAAAEQASGDTAARLLICENKITALAAHGKAFGDTHAAGRQPRRPLPNTIVAVGTNKMAASGSCSKNGVLHYRGYGLSQDTILGLRSICRVSDNAASSSPSLACSTRKSELRIVREAGKTLATTTCSEASSPPSITDPSSDTNSLRKFGETGHAEPPMYPINHPEQLVEVSVKSTAKPPSSNSESFIHHRHAITKSICPGIVVHCDDPGESRANAETAILPCLVRRIDSAQSNNSTSQSAATSITPNQPQLLDEQVSGGGGIHPKITYDAKLFGHQAVTSIGPVGEHHRGVERLKTLVTPATREKNGDDHMPHVAERCRTGSEVIPLVGGHTAATSFAPIDAHQKLGTEFENSGLTPLQRGTGRCRGDGSCESENRRNNLLLTACDREDGRSNRAVRGTRTVRPRQLLGVANSSTSCPKIRQSGKDPSNADEVSYPWLGKNEKVSLPRIRLKRLNIKRPQVGTRVEVGSIVSGDAHLIDHDYSVLGSSMGLSANHETGSEAPVKARKWSDEPNRESSESGNLDCPGMGQLNFRRIGLLPGGEPRGYAGTYVSGQAGDVGESPVSEATNLENIPTDISLLSGRDRIRVLRERMRRREEEIEEIVGTSRK